MSIEVVLFYVISYLIGSIPSGFIFCYLSNKKDIRTMGSGNIGATNVFRNQGRIGGTSTLICDLLKGMIPAAYGMVNFSDQPLITVIAGALAITGHIFPVFLKFRGGKGVAATAGFFAVFQIEALIFLIPVFVAVLVFTRYMSMASVITVGSLFFYNLFTETVEIAIVVFYIALLVIVRHRSNYKRIAGQNEHRIKLVKNE